MVVLRFENTVCKILFGLWILGLHPSVCIGQEMGLLHFRKLMHQEVSSSTPQLYKVSDTLYAMKITTSEDYLDVGVWQPFGMPANAEDLEMKYLLYDENLFPLRMFELKAFFSTDPPYFQAGENVIVGFDLPYEGSVGGLPNISELGYPSIQYYFPEYSFSNTILEYNMVENTLEQPFSVSEEPITLFSNQNDELIPEPYHGMLQSTGHNFYRFESYPIVMPSDSKLIMNFRAFGEHSLNGNEEVNFGTESISLGWLVYDIQNGTTEMVAIGSDEGQLVSYGLFPSAQSGYFYRVGLNQGMSNPFNPNGELFNFAPNDSAFVAFISKEHEDGSTIWTAPLYSYMNSRYKQYDPTLDLNQPVLQTTPIFEKIVELEGKVYIPSRQSFELYSQGEFGAERDTLWCTDFFGNETFENDSVPLYNGFPNPGINPNYRLEKAQSIIRVVDEMGMPYKTLSFTDASMGLDLGFVEFNRTFSNHLFKIADSLAWVNYYNVNSDSTYTLERKSAEGTSSSFTVSVPAGKGSFLVWLDAELNLLDTWIFPFENPQALYGMNIESMYSYGTDSLLVQGIIRSGTSTTLDIFGDSEFETFSTTSTFFAIYGDGELLSTDEKPPAKELAIYPNPGKSSIQITGITESGELRIFDISGRLVISKRVLPQGEPARLDISALSPGVYTAVFRGAAKSGAGKFVKQ
ncbi:MAG: T9SS type A sorting domain-containing protein [Cryomorphaceae bacterium]|nr:T9SS type A sorting domain-containing protein [Flavobacteriales bacterium]